ncbi:MAG: MATE family efflux transporter [Acholeplasmataceae bacterium]|nr:MATE family efflux transporter [Acholeplasmataceae bacterium]
MAIVGVVYKVYQIAISIAIGMAAGCIPIIGYNIGAKQYKRVKQLLSKLIIYESLVGLVALLIVEIIPKGLLSLFGASTESIYYVEFGIKTFRIYLSMIIFACINKATFIFLQAMGKAFSSTVLSMIREIILGVGLVLLLPIWLQLDGVLLSMPLADILTFIISFIIILKTYNELNNQEKNTIPFN